MDIKKNMDKKIEIICDSYSHYTSLSCKACYLKKSRFSVKIKKNIFSRELNIFKEPN